MLYLAAIMTQDVNQYVFHCTTFIWDVCLQTLFLYEVLSSMKVLVGIKEVSLDTPEHVLVLLY